MAAELKHASETFQAKEPAERILPVDLEKAVVERIRQPKNSNLEPEPTANTGTGQIEFRYTSMPAEPEMTWVSNTQGEKHRRLNSTKVAQRGFDTLSPRTKQMLVERSEKEAWDVYAVAQQYEQLRALNRLRSRSTSNRATQPIDLVQQDILEALRNGEVPSKKSLDSVRGSKNVKKRSSDEHSKQIFEDIETLLFSGGAPQAKERANELYTVWKSEVLSRGKQGRNPFKALSGWYRASLKQRFQDDLLESANRVSEMRKLFQSKGAKKVLRGSAMLVTSAIEAVGLAGIVIGKGLRALNNRRHKT